MKNSYTEEYIYDHLVYLRIFEGCNLFCEHCFIPNNPKKIPSNFFSNKNLGNVLSEEANIPHNKIIYLQWHGGEPTLLGPEYIQKSITEIESDNRFIWKHGIQTNLLNFQENKDKWINLYKTSFNSLVGVSWDYKIRHIKKYGLSLEESNQEFENIFWHNVSELHKNNIDTYLVVTATKLFFDHFKNPIDFFNFLIEKGVKKVNLERITNTGYAREVWDKIGLNNFEYSKFMSKFIKYYIQFKKSNPGINFHLSPFDGLMLSYDRFLNTNNQVNLSIQNIGNEFNFSNQGYGCWSGNCDTSYHTIDANGYKHGCTAINSESDNKNKIFKNKKVFWVSSIKEERDLRQESCEGCEFKPICSSGCLTVNKFDSSGECSGGKELFKTIKNIYNSIKEFENV